MPKITKLFVQGLGGGYRHLSNPTWKLLSSHSWLSLMVKLCLQGSGVKMTNQQLVAVGNLFAPGAGKTDSPLTSPWLSSSTSSSSSSLSTITKDAIPWAFNHYPNWQGVAALIVVASLMMYNTHLPSILCFHSILYGTKKTTFWSCKKWEKLSTLLAIPYQNHLYHFLYHHHFPNKTVNDLIILV